MHTHVKLKLAVAALATALLAGCQVEVAPVGVAVEAPVVEVAPPLYVWDGVEYVGDYNGTFMYFGPGGVWVACDPIIIGRFHGWEHDHGDWRAHAIHNDHEHRLDHGHQPAGYRGPAIDHRAGGQSRDHRAPEQTRRESAPAQRAPAPAKRAPAPPKKAPPQKKDDK